MPETEIRQRSANLTQHLVEFVRQRFPHATRIATFAAQPHEPDLSLLHSILSEIEFCYPLVVGKDELAFHVVTDPSTLSPGSYGILEPTPLVHPPVRPEELHLVFVPGLAFDLLGNRLGHGAGFYDRFLNTIPLTPRLGITFASQLLPSLPTEPHDLAVQHIISDQGARAAQLA